MKFRRCIVLLAALTLTACGKKEEPQEGKKEGSQTEKKQESDLTLPIRAPMQARERLLHDTNKAKQAAREREKQFESVINGGK